VGAAGGSEREEEAKKNMRKEKETSHASCIHYGGLTATAVRVADTRGAHGAPGCSDVLLEREEAKRARARLSRGGGSRYIFV